MDAEDSRELATVRKFGGIFDVDRKREYRAARRRKNGTAHMITVEILDAGPEADRPHERFSCVARADDGKAASGNPGPTAEKALALVHWWNLD